jgi:site-specific DNA-methyltransferase (adenine-specific)
MQFTLHHGDCIEVLRSFSADSIDAIVCDPPYGLSFMNRHWDYDVPSVDIWRECLRVLKPGGHLLAFAGTRTQHRMAVNIEEAGFEIRDMIAWVYGSGFPKSLDVIKAIDKAAGAEREVVADGAYAARRPRPTADTNIEGAEYGFGAGHVITAPATDAARQWQGWGTALKPALEPITVARKPLIGTVAENVLRHGTGAINVDGCRVAHGGESLNGGSTVGSHGAHEGWRRPWMDDPEHNAKAAEEAKARVARAESLGRWPANLIHDGSPEVLANFPESNGAGPSLPRVKITGYGGGVVGSGKSEYFGGERVPFNSGTGSAARFFYCAKANRKDRDAGLEEFEKKVTLIGAEGHKINPMTGKPVVDIPRANNHPTVKPTDLMRYLCRLVTPPKGTVLDPFMGSGSTGKAAVLEGFNFVGVEREADYIDIANARILMAQIQAFDEQLEATEL